MESQEISQELEKRLRIIRFFLPRLNRQDLTDEINNEKKIEEDRARRKLQQLKEASDKSLNNNKQSFDKKNKELEIQANKKKAVLCLSLLLGIVSIVLVLTTEHNNDIKNTVVFVLGILSIVCIPFYAFWGIIKLNKQIKLNQDELDNIINELNNAAIEEEKKTGEALLQTLATLETKADSLIRAYRNSIATETEVSSFIEKIQDKIVGVVNSELGFIGDEIQDSISASIWTPSFFQLEDFPVTIKKDILQSQEEIVSLRYKLINPMRHLLSHDQWEFFHERIFSILGLIPISNQKGDKTFTLDPLSAIRFSDIKKQFLAGHYFFQKIVCGRESIGIFRSYANILQNRIPMTFTLNLHYQDVTAIGIQTNFDFENYVASKMKIRKKTRTLSLELASGSVYNMSGDAGSAGIVSTLLGDTRTKKMSSNANDIFANQIINVRKFIKDFKSHTYN